VQSITGRDLRGLHRQSVGKTIQLPFQFWTLLQKQRKRLITTPVRRAATLYHNSRGAGSVSHKKWQADETLFADEANLDTLSIGLNSQNRH